MKQPPTVERDQVNMSEIYDEPDIDETSQNDQELDVSQMDDDVMTSKDYKKMNVRKMDPLDDEVMTKKGNLGLEAIKKEEELEDVICEEVYEELDTEKVDETTQYASLK